MFDSNGKDQGPKRIHLNAKFTHPLPMTQYKSYNYKLLNAASCKVTADRNVHPVNKRSSFGRVSYCNTTIC